MNYKCFVIFVVDKYLTIFVFANTGILYFSKMNKFLENTSHIRIMFFSNKVHVISNFSYPKFHKSNTSMQKILNFFFFLKMTIEMYSKLSSLKSYVGCLRQDMPDDRT